MADAPVSVRILVRPFFRFVSTLAIALGVVTCSDAPPAPVRQWRGTDARVALQPVFSRSAADASRRLSDFGIRYDHVRVVLARSAETVRDTTIAFAPEQPELTLDLTVEVRTADEVFDVSIDYLSTTGPVFHGHGQAHARAPGQSSLNQDPITIEYVGPGANVARIDVSPKVVTVFAGQPANFVVAAFDSANRPLQTVPLAWATSDPAIAGITSGGVLTPTGRTGAVTISVVTPTAVADSAAATVLLPPASISVVSGSGQTGGVGQVLAPLVAVVADQLGNPVPGAIVHWTRTAGAGALGTATSATDSAGRASVTYTLGGVVGEDTVAANVAGVASAAVFALRTLASSAAKIVIVAGDNQVARVNTQLSAPLVVSVVDESGNPVAGTPVAWSAVNGTLGSTSPTGTDGRASATMTLGSRAGSAAATATIANAERVTFSATAQPGPVAALAFSTQPANAGAGSVMSPVRVSLLDASGNQTTATSSVSIALGNNPTGATVTGTLVRSAVLGVATFGDLAIDRPGTGYSMIARSGSLGPVTSSPFNVTSTQPAPPAKLVIVTQPSAATRSNELLGQQPVIQVQDQYGNPVKLTNLIVSVTCNGGTLHGTTSVAASPVTGSATFTDLRIVGSGVATLSFSAPGLPTVTSNPIVVSSSLP